MSDGFSYRVMIDELDEDGPRTHVADSGLHLMDAMRLRDRVNADISRDGAEAVARLECED